MRGAVLAEAGGGVMTTERWRSVISFPAYAVSSRARVRRVATGKILKPWLVCDA
jgi:hypothetical protein